MELQRPFRVVTPTVDGAVLEVLGRADAAFTPPQVHSLAGHFSEDGVRKALVRLAGQGIVTSERVGRAVHYRLNREHLAAPAVVELARLWESFVDRLRTQFEGWAIPPIYAAVFGSAASRSMHSDSDIDLFVARPDHADDDVWSRQIAELTDAVARWTGNDARVLEYSSDDVAHGLAGRDPVLTEIASDGVRIVGPSRYLSKVRRTAT